MPFLTSTPIRMSSTWEIFARYRNGWSFRGCARAKRFQKITLRQLPLKSSWPREMQLCTRNAKIWVGTLRGRTKGSARKSLVSSRLAEMCTQPLTGSPSFSMHRRRRGFERALRPGASQPSEILAALRGANGTLCATCRRRGARWN